MSTSRVSSLMAIAFAVTLPLAAQTPPVANETVGINPAAKNPTSTTSSSQKSTKTVTTSTTTTTHRAMEHHKIKTTHSSSKTAVWTNATRLAALLSDTQGSATISADGWKRMANESNALANKLVAETGGSATARKEATNARMHVREMRTAAMAGDATGAKTHAAAALPFVYKLIDWSAPKS